MSRHTKLFGSTSYRTLQCPAHLQLGKDIPEPPQSEAAAEGSMLHALCEEILKAGIQPVDHHSYCDHLTADQQNIVDTYVSFCREIGADADEIRVEWFAEHPHIHPEWFGTADFVAIKRPRLKMVDLKCGRIPVSVYEAGTYRPNPQVGYYAINVLEDMSEADRAQITEIELVIVQPREGGIKRAIFTRADLDELKERLLVSADEAEGEDPTAVVGPACHFCKVKPYCPKMAEHVHEQARLDFAENGDHASDLTPLEIEQVLPAAKLAIEWGTAVLAEGERRLQTGEDIPGWQLVPKKAKRQWRENYEIADTLRAAGLHATDILETKLKSPAQIEAILKEKKIQFDLSTLTESVSSGLKISQANGEDDDDDHGW